MKQNSEERSLREERIKIISDIDRLKVIANNHLIMKNYSDAIRISEKIIENARTVNLNSIIDEQEDFIKNVSREMNDSDKMSFLLEEFTQLKPKYEELIKSRDSNKAHESLMNFIQKYNEIYNLNEIPEVKKLIERDDQNWINQVFEQEQLKKQLEPLEIQFLSYINTNNVILAGETMKRAKSMIKSLNDPMLKSRWETFEIELLELKKKENLEEIIIGLLEKASSRSDTYQFEEAKEYLKKAMNLIQREDLNGYVNKLQSKLKTILDAEEKYNKLLKKIAFYKKEIELLLEKQDLENMLLNIDELLKVARFIGNEEIVKEFTDKRQDVESKIRKFNQLNHLRSTILELKDEVLNALESGKYARCLENVKEIREYFADFLNSN
jgi:hypothetical protein